MGNDLYLLQWKIVLNKLKRTEMRADFNSIHLYFGGNAFNIVCLCAL